jgi:hypothetical protein
VPLDGNTVSTQATSQAFGYVGSSADPPTPLTRIPSGGSAKLDALNRLNPTTTARRGGLPRIMSLITGTEDETPAQASCVITADTTNTRYGSRAWLMTMAGAVTAYAVFSPVPPATSGLLPFPPAQALCMWIYLPDVTKISYVGVELSQNSGNTVLWSGGSNTVPVTTLVNGWTLVRVKTVNGLQALSTWGNLNRVRVYVVTTAATTATIGHVWLECPEKARLILVLDRGYKSFVTSGALARMRRAGVPVTWALDITLLGTNAGTATEVVSEADIASYAALGDSISFHSWDGTVTSSKTVAEVRTDTLKCIKWLQSRGYNGRIWRAAWTQNLATNYTAAIPYVVGMSQSSVPAVKLGTWPPRDIFNIERWEFYQKTTSEVDIHFDLWQKTYGLDVVYNHGVNTAGGNDATPAEFDYWMTKVEQALTDGWLEAVTFEQLWLESGGDFGNVGGDPVTRYTDSLGAVTTKRVL